MHVYTVLHTLYFNVGIILPVSLLRLALPKVGPVF